jgi:hypothetical protein
LYTNQVQALATATIVSLTSTQLNAISTQTAVSATQFAALATASKATYVTPLVLDLTGNGISTTSVNNGVTFDIAGNGQNVKTGWISEGQGLLVLDPNNASLTSGTQLFGQGTTLANGAKAVDGFQALAALDTNSDGVINSSDAAFNDLKVWVDTSNANGTATGSLESLSQLGITQLNLNAQASTQTNNGNLVGLVSSFNTASGSTGTLADVWFATQSAPAGAASTVNTLTNNVSGLVNTMSSFTQASVTSTGSGTVTSTPSNLVNTMVQFGLNNAPLNQVSVTLNTSGVSNTQTATLAVPSKKQS